MPVYIDASTVVLKPFIQNLQSRDFLGIRGVVSVRHFRWSMAFGTLRPRLLMAFGALVALYPELRDLCSRVSEEEEGEGSVIRGQEPS